MGRQGRILNCVDSFACRLLRGGRRRFARRVWGGMPLLCGGSGCGLLRCPPGRAGPRLWRGVALLAACGRYAAVLWWVRIAALSARQGVDRAFGAAWRGFEADASLLFSPPASRRGRRRFARRVRAGMPLLCGGYGCGLLRCPAAQGAVPKGRQGRILNRAFPCGFYRLLRGGGRPLGTREAFLERKTTPIPRRLLRSRTAGAPNPKKRRYAPRGGVAYRLFLWGVPKGYPFGTRLGLQSVVCYTCWRSWRGKRGAALFAPRLLRPENRPPLCERE